MPIKSNPKIQEFFLWLIRKDRISVYDDGTIINNITGTEYKAIDSGGYRKVSYSYKKKIWQIQAHRLVWIAFNGPITDEHLVINHINGTKLDNNLSNLELVTNTYNIRHAVAMGLTTIPHGGNKPNASFSDSEVKNLRRLFAKNLISLEEIQEVHSKEGISDRSLRLTIKAMLKGITYASVTTKYCEACATRIQKDIYT